MNENNKKEYQKNFQDCVKNISSKTENFIAVDCNEKKSYSQGACQKSDELLEYLCNHDDGC